MTRCLYPLVEEDICTNEFPDLYVPVPELPDILAYDDYEDDDDDEDDDYEDDDYEDEYEDDYDDDYDDEDEYLDDEYDGDFAPFKPDEPI